MNDRKYRHRGYMDSDRGRDEEPRPRQPREDGPPARSEGAPRGRGLGAPTTVVFKCADCGAEIDTALTRVDVGSRCPRCAKPLHTCTNCMFFDPSARFECRKPVAARVESKAGGNDCRFYQPKTVRDLRVATSGPTDPRAAFDALFKKK
jgi:DNA-directed RNA polymerase subunit RPC12/RpoP